MNILKKYTLLYVEDSRLTREYLSSILEMRFKEVYFAKDGKEGLKKYEKYKPDIVLTDIVMPKMSGLEMTKIIKEKNPNQNIIILTAYEEMNYIHDSFDACVEGYILKPVVDMEKFFKPLIKTAKKLTALEEFKRREQLLYQQNRLAVMGEMIDNIAHQWKQPLSAIKTASTGIKLQNEIGCLKKNELSIMLDSISNSVDYLSQTIDDFRNFFNPEKNQFSEFNSNKMFNKIFDLLKIQFAFKNIEVIKDIEDVVINSLESELIQVLINILNNARDALCEIEDEPRYIFIKSYLSKSKDKYIMEICDNGGGIEDNKFKKIFQQYFTTKQNKNGSGIGLFMSLEIVNNLLNGAITASNDKIIYNDKEYFGAKFTIGIPIDNKAKQK